MFNIRTLTVKNFMSVGNQTQAVDFNRDDLTLVLGENLDQGGDDAGARNGTGKTTIINALSYALYGQALTKIKVNNLINKTNGKNMICTVEFEKDGLQYRIERGRKPNFLRFYIEDMEQMMDDEAQGDSRKTQEEIERLLCMTHDMFKHILALNTYTQPFLSMPAAPQRSIIEQLLGITLLSEKAENLKKMLNGDKQNDIKGTKDLIREEEVRIATIKQSNDKIGDTIKNLELRQKAWNKSQREKIAKLTEELDKLSHLDIATELEAHEDLKDWKDRKVIADNLVLALEASEKELTRAEKRLDKAQKAYGIAKDMKCPTCEQELHDDKHQHLIDEARREWDSADEEFRTIKEKVEKLAEDLAIDQHIGPKPDTFYAELHEAHQHQSTLNYIQQQIEQLGNEDDPYSEQIDQLKNEAMTVISYDTLNELSKLKDHQEFLLKLLTNKDSYIRKKIIDQNLSFLNNRLGYYLDKIGLPHTVEFQNDLSVEITEYGRDLDFDNLSRGERNRLILSLSWAFRDVWENLYQQINLLFIDELIDSGMDTSGVDSSLGILKKISRERKKSVWLVSHKDDLASRVNNVLTVTKENGYTSYGTDVEIL